MEIQKINMFKENLSTEDRVELNDALTVLADTYKRMIYNSLSGIVNTKREVDFEESINALQTIKHLAEKIGAYFPNITNKKEAEIFIAKMGNEVLLSSPSEV